MATDGLSSVTPSAATSSGVTPGAGTAETTAADFTCRYFAPKLGIDEDVATGHAHNPPPQPHPPQHHLRPCSPLLRLHPAAAARWRARLDKAKGEALLCLQASRAAGTCGVAAQAMAMRTWRVMPCCPLAGRCPSLTEPQHQLQEGDWLIARSRIMWWTDSSQL